MTYDGLDPLTITYDTFMTGFARALGIEIVEGDPVDHSSVFSPFFAADGAITMDLLWRGEESVDQENLAQWKINGKSLVTQKLVQQFRYW